MYEYGLTIRGQSKKESGERVGSVQVYDIWLGGLTKRS